MMTRKHGFRTDFDEVRSPSPVGSTSGTPALLDDVPGYRPDDLAVISEDEWQQQGDMMMIELAGKLAGRHRTDPMHACSVKSRTCTRPPAGENPRQRARSSYARDMPKSRQALGRGLVLLC